VKRRESGGGSRSPVYGARVSECSSTVTFTQTVEPKSTLIHDLRFTPISTTESRVS